MPLEFSQESGISMVLAPSTCFKACLQPALSTLLRIHLPIRRSFGTDSYNGSSTEQQRNLLYSYSIDGRLCGNDIEDAKMA